MLDSQVLRHVNSFMGGVQLASFCCNKPISTKLFSRAHSQNVQLENSFSALNDDEENEWKDTTTWQHTQQVLDVLNESDSDVDEVITLDDRGLAVQAVA
ncbi:hypothetical protein Tco_0409550 [Tanacetum coccineum]